MSTGNIAEQDSLERDSSDRRLHRADEGVIISRGDSVQVPSRQDQAAAADETTPWLDRSPAGATVIQPSTPDRQAAGVSSSRD